MQILCVRNCLSTILIILAITQFSKTEKILFYFGGGSYSHKATVKPWASELANRNHEVTFVSGVDKKLTDHPKITDINSKALEKSISRAFDIDRFTHREQEKEFEIMFDYNELTALSCQNFLESLNTDPALKPLVNATFDLVVINAVFGECGFILGHIYGAKTIVYDSSITLTWFYEIYGFPPASSWIPDPVLKPVGNQLTFLERFKNIYLNAYWSYNRLNYLHPRLERIMANHFNLDNPPSLLKLERNASLVMINIHPAIDFANSYPPNIVLIGGLQVGQDEKPIPRVYQEFMDDSGPGGVVLISFGSTINLETVPKYYKDVFFNLIEKNRHIRFLLKWKGPLPKEFKKGLGNLLASDWLPQKELLSHPKMLAFVTHGGLNSIQESTYYGVPMIVLPLFADQDYNAYRVHSQNVGVMLEIRKISLELLQNALDLVLNDPKYKSNMIKKSLMFRDRPLSPIDNVIYWTEFVLRHDDLSCLRPQVDHLTWYQKRLLDVYFAYFLIIVGIPMTFICVIIKIVRFATRPTNVRKIKIH